MALRKGCRMPGCWAKWYPPQLLPFRALSPHWEGRLACLPPPVKG